MRAKLLRQFLNEHNKSAKQLNEQFAQWIQRLDGYRC